MSVSPPPGEPRRGTVRTDQKKGEPFSFISEHPFVRRSSDPQASLLPFRTGFPIFRGDINPQIAPAPLHSTQHMSMQADFRGSTALVTGGTRGIGRALVDAFADAGANVAFTYRSSSDTAAALVDALEEQGTETLSLQGDVADLETAQAHVDAVLDRWGTLDVLVNNAGITRDGLMLRMSEDDWDDVIGTNLKGAFNFCKAAYMPMMRQQSGSIVNISSVVGATGNAGQTNYAASKAGIVGFSKSLAKELGGRNVTVNVVAPGYVRTEMTDELDAETREAILDAVTLDRLAKPDEIADAVLFLASPAAAYITGHVLHVNGGLSM